MREGFSITEAVIIMAIITTISAVVLINFGGLNQGVALNRAAREMASNFRRAQNMALAVSYVNVGGSIQVPPAVGINFRSAPAPGLASYRMFADLDPNGALPPPRNNYFNELPPPSEKIGNDILFERGIRIQDIAVFPGGSTPPEVNILFIAPEAVVTITNNGGAPIGEWVEITLVSPNGQTKKVVVRNSGQIGVR